MLERHNAGNYAFGSWSEEDIKWSEKDAAFLDNTLKDSKQVSIDLKQIKAEHEKLGY